MCTNYGFLFCGSCKRPPQIQDLSFNIGQGGLQTDGLRSAPAPHTVSIVIVIILQCKNSKYIFFRRNQVSHLDKVGSIAYTTSVEDTTR